MSIAEIGQETIHHMVYYWATIDKFPVSSIFNMGSAIVDRQEKFKWCITHFGNQTDFNGTDDNLWFSNMDDRVYYFKYESHRTLFIVRWS